QEKKEFWDTFIKREFRYPLAPKVIAKTAKVIYSHDGFINSVSYSPNLVSLIVGLPKKREGFIKNLLKTNLFKDVKILTSSPDRYSKDYEILDLELYVKEWIKDEKK
ncbi:MAG: hypothetical protein GXO21_06535, partial [Aquificae bacterium]|nr:hypothetical protein [Aquificota bacterium]